MRNNQRTAFINLSELSAFVAPSTSSRRIGSDKKKPFIVVNTDMNYGLFTRLLISMCKKLKLKEIDSMFAQKGMRSIKYGEYIVFGDAPGFNEYDYRVETDKNAFGNLDGRIWKVYDLLEDFDKITKRLKSYAEENTLNKRESSIEIEIEIGGRRPVASRNCVEVTRGIKKTEYNRMKDILSFATPKAPTVEDVKIHYNWVKIGYNQYDIYNDLYGREYITLESGTVFYIKADRYGRKYLATS